MVKRLPGTPPAVASRLGGRGLGIFPRAAIRRLKFATKDVALLLPPVKRRFAARALNEVTELLDARDTSKARSRANRLLARHSTSAVGALVSGVIAERGQHHALAVRDLDRAGQLAWALAPESYVNALFRSDRPRGLRMARTLLEDSGLSLPAEVWYSLLAHAYGPGEGSLVRGLHSRAVAALTAEDAATKRRLEWASAWLDTTWHRSAPPVPEGHVSFAIMDYRQPGRDGRASSRNVGDWAQTLASIGHLVRHRGVTFHGSSDLVGLVNGLRERVRPELQCESPSANVTLSLLQRDASRYQALPPRTWALMFGWFMHPLFGLDTYDFPPHQNLQPIFVSFHCAKKDFLSPDAVDYLRSHAPIGCRDWTTVDLLLSLDIPAFFSGCLTTTINTVFPDLPQRPGKATLYVDVVRSPLPPGETNTRQSVPGLLLNTFEQNIGVVVDRLDAWRSQYTHVKTSRLHVYLPCRSVGLDVEYEPDSFSDPRINGLMPLSSGEFESIRAGMRDRLQPVLSAIFAGASVDDVRRLWHDVNAADVRLAEERHLRMGPRPEPRRDVTAARNIRAQHPSTSGPHLVFVPRAAEWKHLPASLTGALRHLPQDSTVWVVHGPDRSFTHADPRIRVVDAGQLVERDLPASRQRDRLLALLSELLPAGRAVLVPVAAVAQADLAELFQLQLSGHQVAARTSSSGLSSGAQAVFRVARAFDHDNERANELLRELFRRHAFDPPWIDAEVLVMDLQAMRDAGTATHLLSSMDHYRLGWATALIFEFGSAMTRLDASWARVPTRDAEDNAKMWVWLDAPKPWTAEHVPHAEVWPG